MKSNELRIDNFLRKETEIGRVKMLTEKGFQVDDSNGYTLGNSLWVNFEPIQLTEEWLIKLGFECKDNVNGGYIKPINYPHQKEFLYCSKRGVVALWNEPENKEFIIMNNCDNVHKLQNLYYALTGSELSLSST